MSEYDCTTAWIEIEETLSWPSSRCREDFETQVHSVRFLPTYGTLVASAILAVAPYSVSIGQTDLPQGVVAVPTNSVIIQQLEHHQKRTVSLSEARQIARELQSRIDTHYQSLLESDAEITAIWEENE